jgi:hypothetical protein
MMSTVSGGMAACHAQLDASTLSRWQA